MGSERIFFYLRLLFLPIIIPLSILRAWTSSWASLERTHADQEARFRSMLGVLPPRLRRQVEEGNAEAISGWFDRLITKGVGGEGDAPFTLSSSKGEGQETVRRFAVLLGDYATLRTRLAGARDASMKSQYLNVLDACSRRLRVAESRQQQAVKALGPRRNPARGRPPPRSGRRRPSR